MIKKFKSDKRTIVNKVVDKKPIHEWLILQKQGDSFVGIAKFNNPFQPPVIGEEWIMTGEGKEIMNAGRVIAFTDKYIFCEP